jgi:PEP-CTERM motif
MAASIRKSLFMIAVYIIAAHSSLTHAILLQDYAIDANLVDNNGTTVFTGQAGTFTADLDSVDGSGFGTLTAFSWTAIFTMDLGTAAANAGSTAEFYVGGISPLGLSVFINDLADSANVLGLTTGNSDNSLGLVQWSTSAGVPGTGFGPYMDPVVEPFGSSYTVRLLERSVPAPSTLALFALGFIGLGFRAKRAALS